MDFDTKTATAFLSALALAREHGGAAAALRTSGVDLDAVVRSNTLSGEVVVGLGDGAGVYQEVRDALALGFLAGRVAHRPRASRPRDPTSFLMDRELLVQGAHGESILRLPWFEEGLFVGRQLPEIFEMPAPIRATAVRHYRAALAGERSRFAFSSYGHAYTVEAVPVRGEDARVSAVLAVATPELPFCLAARAYENSAEGLARSAARAEERAERHRVAGRPGEAASEEQAAAKARAGAERAWAHARRLHSRNGADGVGDAPSLTPRETEALVLASHGLTSAEVAEHLGVSTATVRSHLEHICGKLGARGRAEAVATALRHGLIA